MIRILAVTNDMKLRKDLNIEQLSEEDISWFWVDFQCADEKEVELLSDYFNFHHLAVEDCVQFLQRPKLDHYDDYNFFIFNTLNTDSFDYDEVDLFLGNNYIVTFHINSINEIDESWQRVSANNSMWDKGPTFAMYIILDTIVDQFFPDVFKIEDYLEELDNNIKGKPTGILMDEVFDIRGDLLKLRRLVNSMRDLLYRILNSTRLNCFNEYRPYFADIYDHLLKLSDMIESSRDMTADMRDSFMSMSSNRMNTNMMVLTVISTIFIPLTFIVGVYGMNFEFMPELKWRYGYFTIVGIMIILGTAMFFWFKRKGWFNL